MKKCYVVRAKIEGIRKLQYFPNAPCFETKKSAKSFIEKNKNHREKIYKSLLNSKVSVDAKRLRIQKYDIIEHKFKKSVIGEGRKPKNITLVGLER